MGHINNKWIIHQPNSKKLLFLKYLISNIHYLDVNYIHFTYRNARFNIVNCGQFNSLSWSDGYLIDKKLNQRIYSFARAYRSTC